MQRKFLTLLLAAGLLSGCGLGQLRSGRPDLDPTAILESTGTATKPAGSTTAAAASESIAKALDQADAKCADSRKAETNYLQSCVYTLKSAIDIAYNEYRIVLHHTDTFGNAGLDIGTLALTTAATATPAVATKTVLAAIATVLAGTKAIVDKDLFFQKSIEIVLNQMEADRQQQSTLILTRLKASDYTIEEAQNDLLAYLYAGTWDHALTSLQNKVAANAANCDAQASNAKLAPSGSTTADAAAHSTSTGCAAPTAAPSATPGAATGADLPKIPQSVTPVSGAAEIAIPVASLPVDEDDLSITGLGAASVTAKFPRLTGTDPVAGIVLTKAMVQAAGGKGALTLSFKNLDPAKTKRFIVWQFGKVSDGSAPPMAASQAVSVVAK